MNPIADRSVSITLRARIADFIAGMNSAKKSTQDLSRNMSETGASADRMRKRLEAATRALPTIKINADSSPAEIKFAELRRQLETLSQRKIGIDVDTATAMAEIQTIERELGQLERTETDVNVRADIGAALAELRSMQGEVRRLDGETARVNVDANVSGALANIALVGAALAALPSAVTIGAGVAGLGAAFGAAGAGAAAFGAVAIPAMGRVNEAVKEMGKSTGSAGGATRSAGQAAATAAQQALQLEQAERRVSDAKKAAQRAEEDLTRARQDARRAIQDLNLSLKDAVLSERDAALAVEEARQRLNETLADPKASDLQRQRAQLDYDQAVQRLEDQRVRTKRLQEDTAKANKAGVEGSDQVRAAKDKLAKSEQAIIDAQKQLKVALLQQKAALEQAGGAAGGAASKFDQLSKREKAMAEDLKEFQDGYIEWQRSLEGDVFPAIKGGLDLVTSQLPRISPLVKIAGGSFVGLAKDAKEALTAPFWDEFLWDLGTAMPGAITGLGHTAGNIFMGMAGAMDAVLPHSGDLVAAIESGSKKFADWGVKLKDNPDFKAFVDWVKINAPEVAHLIGDVAVSAGHIVEAVAPFGVGILGGLQLLAKITAGMSPGQIQGIAIAVAAVYTAVKVGGAATKGIDLLSSLTGTMSGAGGAATGAKGKIAAFNKVLLGVGVGLAGLEVAGSAISALSGSSQGISALTRALTNLSKTGKWGGDLGDQWAGGFQTADKAAGNFADGIRETFNPTFWETYWHHPLSEFTAILPGLDSQIDILEQKFKDMDTALAGMVESGHASDAQKAFAELAKQAQTVGVPVDKLREIFPQYALAMSNTVEPTQSAASATDTAKQRLDGLNRSLDTFSGRTDHLTALRNMEKGYIAARDAIDAASGKLDFNAKMTDAQRDAVIKARDQFGGYLQKVRDGAEAQKALSGKTTDATRTILEQLPKMMDLAGKNREAREQVLKLAEAYGISRQDAIKAAGSAKGLKEALDKLKSKQLRIDMDTKAAEDKLKRLYDWQLKILGASRDLPEGIRAPKTKKKADGGISLNAFAGGGITYFASGTENHVAQIAPAGAMRVWAEPETGGEAYIPLAASKRARSAEILAATAGIMGYQLMPAGRLALIAAADGGLLAGSMPPSLAGLGGLTALDTASRTLGHRLVEVAARVGRAVSGTGPDESPRSPARTSRPQMGDPVYYSGVASGKPQPGPLGGRLAGETEGKGGRGDRPTINIEKYYEAEGGSATKTAEDLNFIGRRY